MYQTYYKRPRKNGTFLPFLTIIIFGLIVVLGFQIYDYYQEKRLQALENKAAVEVIAGTVDMKIFGVEQWTRAATGSILHEGDVIRTAPGSRAVLSLLNGSVARLSAGTEVELSQLKSRDGQDEAEFALQSGNIWIKRTEKDSVKTSFKVLTDHLEVSSLGTIFNVEKAAREGVQVLDGKVQVVVRVPEPDQPDTIRIVDTLEVALGQEVSLGQEEMQVLQARKPIQLIALLSDSFRASEWYSWNRADDSRGESALAIADAVATGTSLSDVLTAGSSTIAVPEVIPAPVITSPAGPRAQVTTDQVAFSGSTSTLTQKLEVTTYTKGTPSAYVLQKYVAGSKDWSYTAAVLYGNLVEGENRFTFIAIGKNGLRSTPTEITIRYEKDGTAEPVVSTPTTTTDLTAPHVETINGTRETTVSADLVTVTGTVGKGVAKVFVNDFQLSRYVAGSGSWIYFAKTSFGNLHDGDNEFTVYGVAADGKKTELTKFTIVKKPSEVPTASGTTTPATGPQ